VGWLSLINNRASRFQRIPARRTTSARAFPLARVAVLAGIAILLILVGTLQYRFNAQIKRAAEVRIGADLESVMMSWHLDLYGEFSTICVALQVGPDSGERDSWEDYLHRYTQWSRAPKENNSTDRMYVNRDLVKEIYVWETSRSIGARLLRLNPEKETIEKSAIPPNMVFLLHHLSQNSSNLHVALHAWESADLPSTEDPRTDILASRSHLLRSNAETGWQFDEDLPALVHPIFHYVQHGSVKLASNSLNPIDWVVVLLNFETIQRRVLPELVQRYFRGKNGLEYKLAVISEGKAARRIYSSDAGFDPRDVSASDSVMNIFGPPPQSTEGNLWQTAKNRVSVKGEDWHRFSSPVWFPIIQYTSNEGPWLLVLRNREGPLDSAVTRVWRSNLFISGFVLLLLSTSMALVVAASQHAQALARQQIGFVASVSHELHTPITVILSACENITDGFAEGIQNSLLHGSIIRRQARRLKDLVDQILLFASMGSGKSRYTLCTLDATEVVECAQQHALVLAQEGGFTIEQRIQEDLPTVSGDLSALSQCLQNLIANAFKYSGKSSWIGIAAEVHESENHRHEVRISIHDHGIGISKTELPHIFEPFHRAPEVVGTEIRGTGLGLAIAKHIAEAMGGKLSVTSEVRIGSVFTLHLPVSVEAPSTMAPTVGNKRGGRQ
jgi:signal transduction histidine kinase